MQKKPQAISSNIDSIFKFEDFFRKALIEKIFQRSSLRSHLQIPPDVIA